MVLGAPEASSSEFKVLLAVCMLFGLVNPSLDVRRFIYPEMTLA